MRHAPKVVRSFAWGAAIGAFTLIAALCGAHATTYLPSIRIGTAALISPTAANTYYGSGTTSSDGLSSLSGVETPVPPEIVELARALKENPDLIYQYVRNNIQNVWMYGLAKGALGTEIDKAGTPFDQAELMVALLRQAGYTANYVAGTITPSATQFYNWTGITNARAACQLLSSGGFPASVNGTTTTTCGSFDPAATVSSIQMAHIWVRVLIAGSHSAGCDASDYCVFDPSYKSYTWKAGIPLATAMGFTSGDPLSDATNGMQSGTDPSGAPWVKTLNAGMLDSALAGYGNNLSSYIQSHNLQGAQIEDIVSGGVIVPDLSIVRQAALGYVDPSPPYGAHSWTPPADVARYNAIPDQYRTTLQVDGFMLEYTDLTHSHDGTMFNVTFYSDEIYGRRLTVDTDFTNDGINNTQANYYPNKVTLKLDGAALANVPTYVNTLPSCCFATYTARGLPSHIQLTANHPYAASADGTATTNGDYMDAALDKPVVLVTPLTIVHGWGDVSPALFKKWSDERASDTLLPMPLRPPYCPGGMLDPCPNNFYSATGDFQREKTAAAWLGQMTRAARLNAAIANAVPQLHHMLGFVYGDVQLDPTHRTPTSPPDFVENDSFDRIDIDGGVSFTSKTADAAARRAAIQSFAASSATLEGSLSGQLADLPDNSSTISRFEWGNSPPVDAKQNPRALGPQSFYQFTAATVAAAAGIVTSEGYLPALCPANDGFADWNAQPEIATGECIGWATTLTGELSAYAAAGFTIVASRESFLGPGQRGGGIVVNAVSSSGAPLNYSHFTSKQRGGAFIATHLDASGEPDQIAHIILGLAQTTLGDTTITKGGGGGGSEPDTQKNYNPSDAADILKSRFVDRSNALGVNLSNGSLAYSSPVSLRIGNGDFPYELSGSLTFQPGPPQPGLFGPVAPTQPQPGWKMNWLNNLAMSGSGMEAMGQSDIRAAIGTIVALYATQDIYKAAQSVQRDAAAPLALAWWSHQLVGNVATVSLGADSKQFVQLYNGQWILPGAGFAALAQTGSRVPYEQLCAGFSGQPYPGARGWDYSGVSFALTNAHGDKENFGYWLNTYNTTDASVCGQLKGFRLTSWTFPFGVTVTPTYTATGGIDALTDVHNSVGRKITVTPTQLANGLTSTDARSMAIAATDSNGNIPSMTDPAGKVTSYAYQTPVATSATARPIPYSLLTQVTTPDNTAQPNVQYNYDSLGRVEQVVDAYAILHPTLRNPYSFFIADGTRGERDDPLGGAYTVGYDTYGQPSRYIDEIGRETDAIFDSRTRVTQYTYPEQDQELFGYDDQNNMTSYAKSAKPAFCTHWPDTCPQLTASAVYDQTWNKPLTVTDARGQTTTLTYYASGNGTSLLGTATRPADASGIHGVYSFTYDAAGKALTASVPFTSTQSIVTTNTYDATTESLLTTILDAGTTPHVNATTSFGYDAQGDVDATTDPRGNVTVSFHDSDRRKTEDDHHQGVATAPLDAVSKTIYDAIGRDIEDDVAKCFDTATPCLNAGSTVVTWVAAKKTTYTPTSKVATVTDADSRVTTSIYDNNDRLSRVMDPIGRQVRTIYDAAAQITREIRAWNSGSGCSVSGTLQQCYASYTYGGDGEKLSVMDANGVLATPQYKTSYLYDGFNRVNVTTFPDGSTEQIPLSGGYDANGNILSRINRAGQTLSYSYDNLNRMVGKTMPLVTGVNPIVTTNWVYYLNNAIADINDSNGNDLYTLNNSSNVYYDTAGRLVRTDTTIPGITGFLTTSYVLDANGNRTQLTWPDGYYVVYAYDALNRMISATENGSYLLATYVYDAMSRRTNLAYPASSTVAYGYSDAGDLLTLNHSSTGSVPHYTLGYTNAHQLSSEASSDSTYLWQPPATGTDTYTAANNLNQYPSWTPSGGSLQNFSYDANGNMTAATLGAYNWTFAYDPENRLITACRPACSPTPTVDATYQYDPLGRRNGKSGIGVTTTYFIDDGTDEIADYNGSGVVTRYVPGPAINQPIATVNASNGARRFFQTDHHGSTIAMVNSAGAEVEGPYLYDSHGNCYIGAAACTTVGGAPYKFVGMRQDTETGLYFDRARFYASIVGRFLQTDPVGYTADLNLYTYGGNDPTDKTDPSGNSAAAEGAAIGCAADMETGCAPGAVVGAVIGALVDAAVVALGVKILTQKHDSSENNDSDKNSNQAPPGIGHNSGNNGGNNNQQGPKLPPPIIPPSSSEDTHASTPTGTKSNPVRVKPGTNAPTTIGGRDYTGHAQDRMQGRGIPPSVIEHAITNGTSQPGSRPGTTEHHDSVNNVTVVTDTATGRVITTFYGH